MRSVFPHGCGERHNISFTLSVIGDSLALSLSTCKYYLLLSHIIDIGVFHYIYPHKAENYCIFTNQCCTLMLNERLQQNTEKEEIAVPHNRPIQDHFYGFSLYYRIENRQKAKAIVISHRIEDGNKPRINYECKPIERQSIQRMIAEFELAGQGLLEALPPEIMTQCMNDFIGLGSEDSRKRRRSIPNLTFGVLLAADKEKLIYETGEVRDKATIDDEERILKILLEKVGPVCWSDVTPELCVDWLARQSEHDQKAVKRLMLRFQRLQLQAGLLDKLSWEDYKPGTITRKRKSSRSLIQNNIEPAMLTTGQCSYVINTIFDHVNEGTVSEVDMAILLKLTLCLDEEYISALNLSDFQALDDYKNRYVVAITHVEEKSNKNYIRREISDPYERRLLPIPSLVAECYRALLKKRKVTDLCVPLIPSRQNALRRMSPADLKKEERRFLDALQIVQITDAPKIKRMHAVDLLAVTGERELLKCGIEEEELRLMKGQRPQLVSGRHYYDRNNEAALNKIGALMDRWVGRIYQQGVTQKSNSVLSKKGSSVEWIAEELDCRTQVFATITIPPVQRDKIPPGGIELELSTLHGMTGTIYQCGGKKHEQPN